MLTNFLARDSHMRLLILLLIIPMILTGQTPENSLPLPETIHGEPLLLAEQTNDNPAITSAQINNDKTASSITPSVKSVLFVDQSDDKTQNLSDQTTDQSIKFLGQTGEKTNKWLYAGAVVLTLVHKSLIDARIWEKSERPLPGWVKSDEVYLGGTALTVGLLAYTSYNYGKDATLWQFIKTTAISFLIGSEIWDLEFGHLVHGDALYPFPKWYGNWGFKNKTERVAFDVGRLAAAAVLLLWDF